MAAAGRIAVCVSGEGSNLRALHAAQRRGLLGGSVSLVLADRDCRAIDFAASQGIPTAVVRPSDHADRGDWDTAVTRALRGSGADLVVLAGFMRVVGAQVLAAFPRRIVNVHPSLLPAFPGRDAVVEALAAGVRVTGVTVHIVDAALDGGPIVLQEAVPVLVSDDRDALLARLHGVEHAVLPRAVALMLAGAVRVGERGVTIDAPRAAALPRPRRALLSVSDKRGVVELGIALEALGFELVSTGGTARVLREAGTAVTDVATVTGTREMLDGRVKTLHPRIAAGLLADLRREDHRRQLVAAGIDPFELVVVNLYPFAEASARPSIGPEELIEEIDIGGPTLVRAAAKNHANVAVVTDPRQYTAVIEELRRDGTVSGSTRLRMAVDAFRHTAAYDARVADVLPHRLGLSDEAAFPERLVLDLERVQPLRYGENPHQGAALYRRPGTDAGAGPFASGVDLRQGKELSYNNILDASAAAALARDLRGAGCAIVKHANPCGVAEAGGPVAAWEAALAGDPVSAYGGVVAVTASVSRSLAERLAGIFLEVLVAPGIDSDAVPLLARKPSLRVVVDPTLEMLPREALEFRTAGGGFLVADADVRRDDPAEWRVVTERRPTEQEALDLDLAWRVCRHVRSNAIVLVRDAAMVGVGAGQMSRVDSARLAVGKAGTRASGAVCASDAFFPFADGVTVCTQAGVTAFVQPGGSQGDADVIAAADQASAAMVITGTRHFRH